jgi:hypothetical protein
LQQLIKNNLEWKPNSNQDWASDISINYRFIRGISTD